MNPDDILAPALTGTPMFASSSVPLGNIMHTKRGIYFHQHTWVRWRKRRGHGRARPAPRRVKVLEIRTVTEPAIEELMNRGR